MDIEHLGNLKIKLFYLIGIFAKDLNLCYLLTKKLEHITNLLKLYQTKKTIYHNVKIIFLKIKINFIDKKLNLFYPIIKRLENKSILDLRITFRQITKGK